MHLFFTDHITEGISGSLGKEESHHAQRVLRLKEGDTILVTAGKGIIYKARIVSPSNFHREDMSPASLSAAKEHRTPSSQGVLFNILEKHSEEKSRNYLHIAIAPTKSLDRFEFFLEKATEAGVDEITPLIGFHSERKVYKTERGKRIIMAAAKQSLSHWLPVLNEAVAVHSFLQQEHQGSLFIAHCDKTGERQEILGELSRYSKATVLIGPEGDFSPEEVALATKRGFHPVSLGNKRLRTETAGVIVAFAGKIF